jgi:hypothetical protein
MRFILMVSAAALVVPSLSAGQAAPIPDWPLTPGLRVRVLSAVLGDKQQTGSVVSATSDTVVFLAAKQSASTALSTPNIAWIEVARGTHTHKLKGGLIGFALGGALAAGYTAATWKKSTTIGLDFGRGGDAAFVGVFGGLVGGLVGLLVGSQETDTWVPVKLPNR